MRAKLFTTNGHISAAAALAIAGVGIAMLVLEFVLHRHNYARTVYAIPVLLVVGAGVIAQKAVRSESANRRPAGRKVPNNLVALSSAAILTVFAAGYDRTSQAADQIARQSLNSRRRPIPVRDTQPVIASVFSPIPDKSFTSAPTTTAPPEPSAAEVQRPVKVEVPIVPLEESAPEPPSDPADDSEYAEGTFLGRGTSRHGDVQVQIEIHEGMIASAPVSKCMTQYSCELLIPVSAQLVNVQNPDKIDNVSGATQSVNAYYGGVLEALAKSANVKTFQRQFKPAR